MPCENENGDCSKSFPKTFQPETKFTADGYPEYRRSNTSCSLLHQFFFPFPYPSNAVVSLIVKLPQCAEVIVLQS